MVDIPTIEPFQFIRSTAFSERVQLANKLNEVIDALNQIGSIDDLQTQIDAINSKVSELEESIGNTDTSLADLENQVNALISEVNTTIKQGISALESDVEGIDTRLTTAEGTISEHGTEIDGLLKEVVDGVAMMSNPHGTIRVQINHEDGTNDISAPIDLGLVEQGGIVLRSGTTDRSFKLIVTLTDGTSWQTNDFVIPEGGGTDVSVTNISIAQGTSSNMIQVKIGLSDGSTISSNDWTVVTPSEFSALGTRVTTAEGKITAQDGEISDLDSRVQALEDLPAYTLQPATAARLGGVKIGAGIIVQSDGTISVDKTQINTAAVASTVKFTADASKVTLHTDSIAGSEFTKDIPQASQGGAGTIDQASYAKIAATEAALNELGPTVTVNEDVSPAQITVVINGKSSTANLPSSGGWEKLDPLNLPSDFSEGDILFFNCRVRGQTQDDPDDWNAAPSDSLVSNYPTLTAMFKLKADQNSVDIIGDTNIKNNSITHFILSTIQRVDNWNNLDTSTSLILVDSVTFNGGGIAAPRDGFSTFDVSRSTISSGTIYRMRG